MSDAAEVPAVQKLGSRWEAQIVAQETNGCWQTNIRSEELRPYLATSKVWFNLGLDGVTLRGVTSSYEKVQSDRPCAFVGAHGFISIYLGKFPQTKKMKVGDKLRVDFHV